MGQKQVKRMRRQFRKVSKEVIQNAILEIQKTRFKARIKWLWRILIRFDYYEFKKRGLIDHEKRNKLDPLKAFLSKSIPIAIISIVLGILPFGILKIYEIIIYLGFELWKLN